MSKSVSDYLQFDKDSVGLLYKREMRNFPTLNDVHSVRPTCTMYICQRPLTRAISMQKKNGQSYFIVFLLIVSEKNIIKYYANSWENKNFAAEWSTDA